MTPEQNFYRLLNKYIDKTASSAEEDELMMLIRTGKFREQLQDRIDAGLLDESEFIDMPIERAQEILNSIVDTEETKVVGLILGAGPQLQLQLL